MFLPPQGRRTTMMCTLKSGQKSRLRIFRNKRKGQQMKFSKDQIEKLEQNANVKAVINNSIHYTAEFKNKAIDEYLSGKSAREIFIEAGFNLQEISTVSDYASRMISKWRKANAIKTNIHYPKKKIKENKTNYQKMQARLEYLEAENEFLKKLQALIQQQE